MNDMFLAFDFGMKSIGVAIGQRITKTACPLHAIKARNGVPNWSIIKYLFEEVQPNMVIIGHPVNIDGTEQLITTYARKFANRIYGRFGVVTKLHDERLSTIEARSMLLKNGYFRALTNKGNVDSISAVVILESYFDQLL